MRGDLIASTSAATVVTGAAMVAEYFSDHPTKTKVGVTTLEPSTIVERAPWSCPALQFTCLMFTRVMRQRRLVVCDGGHTSPCGVNVGSVRF